MGSSRNLHGHPDGAAFAVALTEAAATHYGTPFVAFVEALIRDRATSAGDDQAASRSPSFPASWTASPSPSGQVRRVAARFGLVAVAGELATAEGITGWPEGAAHAAAARCFADWLKARGGPVSAEERELLTQVRYFFEQHGNRFRWKDRALDDHAPEVPRQAGFKDDPAEESGGVIYYAFPETFKAEIVQGYDPTDAARVLLRRGLLLPDSEGRPTQKVRLPGHKNPVRVYVLTSRQLEARLMDLDRLNRIFARTRPDARAIPARTAGAAPGGACGPAPGNPMADPPDWQEAREERAAIMEHDGGLTRADAEAAAARLHPDRTPDPATCYGFTLRGAANRGR